ncbi:hypothetical protein Bhyg_15513 [Pseudolycoriella hygida]|uniref:ZP domain-containing protein n=1 Tax=Pseudolycoriella hygida TaxID=35572 RepID=A0A9Q0ML77_9DIPT|nr:hypothetical protein Bhyg_15513 [Pseudolycoriella hygida]
MWKFFVMIVLLQVNYLCVQCSDKKSKLTKNEAEARKKKEQIWEQDLGDTFKIDASTEGLQMVHLKCGSNSMHVELETKDNFSGVMYTRGSFYKQAEPCFVKGKSSRSLRMQFPIDQCQTIQEGDVYKNVVVVQHDPELVTPGDAAFSLECDFRTPRSITVNGQIQARNRESDGESLDHLVIRS